MPTFRGGFSTRGRNPAPGTAGAATQLVFSTQPAGASLATPGGTLLGTQPVVQVRDVNNNVVTTWAGQVLLTYNSSSNSGVMSGTVQVTVVAGVATFTNVKIASADAFTLTATAVGGGLTPATSNSISMTSAQPADPGATEGVEGLVAAGSFVVGHYYTITTVGTTNFTAIGASANTVGISFTATGAGTGSGVASVYLYDQTAFIDATSLTIDQLGAQTAPPPFMWAGHYSGDPNPATPPRVAYLEPGRRGAGKRSMRDSYAASAGNQGERWETRPQSGNVGSYGPDTATIVNKYYFCIDPAYAGMGGSAGWKFSLYWEPSVGNRSEFSFLTTGDPQATLIMNYNGVVASGAATPFGTYSAGAFTVGTAYVITVVGTTNFMAIGASANTIGVRFTATGVGSGTGKAGIYDLPALADGLWHCMVFVAKPQTGTSEDGTSQAYLDGFKMMEVSTAAIGVTPSGGTKAYCTAPDVPKVTTKTIGGQNQYGGTLNASTGPFNYDTDQIRFWKAA